MANPLTWLSRRRHRYEPLITVEISRSAIIHNLRQFQKLAPAGHVAPVLKSNAYGHGLSEVARILEHVRNFDPRAKNNGGPGGIPFFVIDSYFEAVALRSQGIRTPLLVVGYTRPETILSSRLANVAFALGSLEAIRGLEPTEREIAIHLKVDTGMHRQGILPAQIPEAANLISENNYIRLEGICSHLADADNPDPSFTEGQIHVWAKAVHELKSRFPLVKFTHLSASDGHRFTGDIDANVSRLGIGLYGIAENSVFMDSLDLKPAMRVKTIIATVKDILRDDAVGYGATFRATKDMSVATVPFGYFEGLDRRLSNVGSLVVGPDRIPCPIVGRISMNIATIDVSAVPNVTEGMEVTVIGDGRHDVNSIPSMAKLAGTIPYEIAVHIPGHLKRVVVE